MTLRIRHVLDTKDIYAVYFFDPPRTMYNDQNQPIPIYATALSCLYMALVARESQDNPEEILDEIIGFVIDDDGIVPADETSDGTTFMWYANKLDIPNWQSYLNQVQAFGKASYEAKHPPEIKVPDIVLQEPTKQRRKRQR